MPMANANRFNLSTEFEGLDEFVRGLDGWEESFHQNLKEGMDEYGLLLEEGSRALVHRDSGDLESSIEYYDMQRRGDAFEGQVGSDLKYAMRRHEEPYRSGTHDKYDNGVKFEDYYLNGRGRRTYRKGKWRGLPPGRKYVERAFVATEQDFNDIMAEVQDKTLRGLGR